jgi:hypothetical protein
VKSARPRVDTHYSIKSDRFRSSNMYDMSVMMNTDTDSDSKPEIFDDASWLKMVRAAAVSRQQT